MGILDDIFGETEQIIKKDNHTQSWGDDCVKECTGECDGGSKCSPEAWDSGNTWDSGKNENIWRA